MSCNLFRVASVLPERNILTLPAHLETTWRKQVNSPKSFKNYFKETFKLSRVKKMFNIETLWVNNMETVIIILNIRYCNIVILTDLF